MIMCHICHSGRFSRATRRCVLSHRLVRLLIAAAGLLPDSNNAAWLSGAVLRVPVTMQSGLVMQAVREHLPAVGGPGGAADVPHGALLHHQRPGIQPLPGAHC